MKVLFCIKTKEMLLYIILDTGMCGFLFSMISIRIIEFLTQTSLVIIISSFLSPCFCQIPSRHSANPKT